MSRRQTRIRDRLRAGVLAGRLLAGRRFWLVALVPLLWPAFHAFMLLVGGRDEAFERADAQNFLIGLPLTVLAIFVGVRVIAGELDARRLEIAYTVPGGSQRVWLGKLLAGWTILLASEALLGIFTFAFLTSYPPAALYGALQAATFYLVLAMGLAALFKSEITGAMVAVAVLVVSTPLTGTRLSPFWNPLSQGDAGVEAVQLLAWALQNRIGFLLAIVALAALAFTRAERREKMLSG